MSDIYDHYRVAIATAHVPTVLEIGMGRGEDTVRLLQLILDTGRAYQYYGFEPEAKNIPFIRALPYTHKFHLVEAAVGDYTGQAPFRSSGDWPYSGSLKEPRVHLQVRPDIKFSEPVQVRVVKLDDFGFDHVDFIWCDAQGAEDLVITGGGKTFARTRYFYTEYGAVELYAGQLSRDEIHRRLPGRWELVHDFGDNVLFHNCDFP